MAFDYHRMSETFTEHFPINQSNKSFQLAASSKKPPSNYFTREAKTKYLKQKQPILTLDELDQGQKLEYRNHPFTFQNETVDQQIKTKQQRSYSYMNAKNKKFSFEDYQETANRDLQQRNNLSESIENSFFFDQRSQQYQTKLNSTRVNQNFMVALDDYLDYLSQSQNILNDRSTLQTDQSTCQQTLLVQKLQQIKEFHELSLQKQMKSIHQIKLLKRDNELLSAAMVSSNVKLQTEREKTAKLQKLAFKLQHDLQEMTGRCKYIQNSFIKERIENENNKVLYNKILTNHLNINQTEEGSESSTTPDTQIQKKQEDIITQYLLKNQMKKLRKNNKEIQRLQQSMHMSRRYSQDIQSSSQLESDSIN